MTREASPGLPLAADNAATITHTSRGQTPRIRSTNRSTELTETSGTDTSLDGLRKPHMRRQACISRYRTQEVAGSSPASSTNEVAGMCR